MAHLPGNPRYQLISPQVDVYFAGFRSDTLTLHRAGWQIAVDETDHGYVATMFLRHPTGKFVATATCRDFMTLKMQFLNGSSGRFHGVFNVQHISHDIIVEVFGGQQNFGGFNLIDPRPLVCERTSLHDLEIFKRADAPTGEELIVDPATVSELLDRIHRMQEPGQRDIRERTRRREVMPTAVASIVAFPKAA